MSILKTWLIFLSVFFNCSISLGSGWVQSCQSLFGGSVATVAKRSKTEIIKFHRRMGLPNENYRAAQIEIGNQKELIRLLKSLVWPEINVRFLRRKLKISESEQLILLLSDLGPSIWSKQDLQNWFSMGKTGVLRNAKQAFKLMSNIASSPTYCPAGLTMDQCYSLLHSLQARRAAGEWEHDQVPYHILNVINGHDKHYVRYQPEFLDDQKVRDRLDFFMKVRGMHIKLGIPRFPWGATAEYPDLIAPHHAKEIFAIMTREQLVRRLLFLDMQNYVRLTGDSIDSESQFVLASHPQLLALLPVFLSAPLKLDHDQRVGTHDTYVLVWDQYEFKGRSVSLVIRTDPIFRLDPRTTFVFIVNDLEDPFSRTMPDFEKILENSIREWLVREAGNFAKLQNTKNLKIQIVRDYFPTSIEVKVNGGTESDKMLFMFYVLTRPPPVGMSLVNL